MSRNFILCCGSLFLCLAVPAVSTAMTFDESIRDSPTPVSADADSTTVPAAAVEERVVPQVSPASVQMIPIYSFGADLHKMQQMASLFKNRLSEKDFEQHMLLELGEESVELGSEPNNAKFVFNGYLTNPAITYYGDLVCSLPKGMADAMKQDSDFKKLDDGVYESDGMTVVMSDTSYAATYGDDLAYSSKDVTRLRRFMQESAAVSVKQMCFVRSEPSMIGRSAIKPQLNAVRAMLHTQAQRRDDEPELTYLARSTQYRTFVTLLDAFFNETKSVEYFLDFDKDAPSISVSVTINAVTGTSLDKYISRLHSQRSSLLTYLHPDQQGFVSATIPLSNDLAENLPQIAGLGAQAIVSAGGDTSSLSGIDNALQQIADDKSIECLVQALPSSDETFSYIVIVPLQEAGSLQAPLIQLVSAVATGTKSEAVPLGSLGQWPVHNLSLQGLGLSDGSSPNTKHSFVVSTDNCIAWCLASEEDYPVLQAVLERDFEETPAAKRFQRTAFAASTTHSGLKKFSEQIFDDSIPDLMVPDGESPMAEGRLGFRLNTAPHQITLTAKFDNNAIGDGMSLVSANVDMLLELLESFYE